MSTESYRPVAGIVVIRQPIPIPSNFPEIAEDDIHSLQRHKNKRLYLLVKKPRNEHAWQFPQGGLKKKKPETIVQGALRELKEECGNDLKVKLIDQTDPVCIYQYRFPDDFIQKSKRSYIGAKVHFIRAEWISGQCDPDNDEIIDYAWLTREEISSYVSPNYKEGIQSVFY